MNKYTLKAIRTKGGLKLQVRNGGKIVCSLHLHKWYSRAFCSDCFDIEVHTDAGGEFWAGLSEKMRDRVKHHVKYEEDVWNYGFTICTR